MYVPRIYTADGETDTFSISFPYLSKEHIEVRVDGELVEDIEFPTSGQVMLAEVPKEGSIVVITRKTPLERIVDFNSTSFLSEGVLDLDSTQLLFLIQEALAEATDALGTSSYDVWNYDARGKRIVNLGDPIFDNDAVHKKFVTDSLSDVENLIDRKLNDFSRKYFSDDFIDTAVKDWTLSIPEQIVDSVTNERTGVTYILTQSPKYIYKINSDGEVLSKTPSSLLSTSGLQLNSKGKLFFRNYRLDDKGNIIAQVPFLGDYFTYIDSTDNFWQNLSNRIIKSDPLGNELMQFSFRYDTGSWLDVNLQGYSVNVAGLVAWLRDPSGAVIKEFTDLGRYNQWFFSLDGQSVFRANGTSIYRYNLQGTLTNIFYITPDSLFNPIGIDSFGFIYSINNSGIVFKRTPDSGDEGIIWKYQLNSSQTVEKITKDNLGSIYITQTNSLTKLHSLTIKEET